MESSAIRAAAFRILEPPLTYRPWGPEIWKAHIAGPSPIQNGLWDPQRERPKVMLLFVFSSIRSFPSFLPPLLCCFLPSFLPSLLLLLLSTIFVSAPVKSNGVEYEVGPDARLCMFVCVCVVGPIDLLPNLRKSFDFWES